MKSSASLMKKISATFRKKTKPFSSKQVTESLTASQVWNEVQKDILQLLITSSSFGQNMAK